MQLFKVGKCYKVARVTGPSHNFLGLEFASETVFSQVVVDALPTGKKESNCLSESAVLENVLLGVADANQKYGTAYIVKRIEYISDDTPHPEVYRFLAQNIIEMIETHKMGN